MKRNAFLILGLLASCATTLPIARAYPVGGNTGTLGAANAAVATNITTFGACTTLISSGLTGTVTFEESNDGNSWAAVTSFPDAGSGASGSQTVTNPSAALYQSPVSGYGFFRVRVSSYGTGSATATVNCNNGSTTAMAGQAIASIPPFVPATTLPVQQVAAPTATTPVNGNVGVCGIGGVTPCAAATATPPPSGYAAGSSLPVIAQLACVYNSSASVSGSDTNQNPIGCAGGGHGAGLTSSVCQPAADAGAACAGVTAINADSVAATGNTLNAKGYTYRFNGSTWDRTRSAASPAPTGITAIGYNAGGASAPVICTQKAHISLATTQATETVLVPSAAGKTVFICSVTAVLTGTVAGLTALGNSTTNTCGANASTVMSFLTPNGSNQVATGMGMGEVGVGAVGDALCAFLGGTPALTDITVMYEQF